MNNKKYFLGNNQKITAVKSMDFLKDVNPKFAEHMYNQNRIVEAISMSEFGGIDVLDSPVCGRCDQPGWNIWNPNFVSSGDADKDREVRNCYCVKCGTTTYNTLTVRQYLIEVLRLQENIIQNFEKTIYGGIAL
jgi:hypothetical protein